MESSETTTEWGLESWETGEIESTAPGWTYEQLRKFLDNNGYGDKKIYERQVITITKEWNHVG